MTRSTSLFAFVALCASVNHQSTLHLAEARRDRIDKKNVNPKKQQKVPTVSPSYNPTEWPTWFPTVEQTPKPTNKRQGAKGPGGANAKAPDSENAKAPGSGNTNLRPPAPAPAAPKNDIAPPPLVDAGIVIANDDSLSLPPGTEEAFVGVLENDTGSNLRVQSIDQQGSFGTCAISITLNEVVYSPNSADFIGSDECVYEACDDEDDCDTARLRITIKEVITSDPTLDVTRPPSPEPTADAGTESTLSPTGSVTRPTPPTARPITPFPTEEEPDVETVVPTLEPTGFKEAGYGSYSYDSYDNKYVDGYIKHFSSEDSNKSSWSSGSSSHSHASKSGKSSKGSKGSKGSGSWSGSSSSDGSWDSATYKSHDSPKYRSSSGSGSGSSSGGSWDSPTYDSPSYHSSDGGWSSSSGGSWSGSSGSSSSSGKSGKSGKARRHLRH